MGHGTVTTFDVFLSHNGKDKPQIRELKQLLFEQEKPLRSWLDEDELRPGINWQPLLEEGIRASKSVAVLIAADGLGPWEDEEMQAALNLAVQDKRPIIPVLLPGCPTKPELPLFLGTRTWVDLRDGYTPTGIAKLIWGITGEKPDQPPREPEPPQEEPPTTPAELWPAAPDGSDKTDKADCYLRLREICSRGEVPKGDERKALWQAVKKRRPSSFPAWQLANVARWSAPEYLEVEERFTPLQVSVRVRESAEGPTEKQQLSCNTLAEAMTAVFDDQMAPASVVFAPPGGGKSTLLRHYHLNQARRFTGGDRLVFYVQLRDYRPAKRGNGEHDPDHPALAWLESEWRKQTDQAPPLVNFMRQGSLTLLLDGLNEIPRDSDDEYKVRVGEWRDLVNEVEQRYPGVRLLFACRPLDYSQRLDSGSHTRLPEIEVQAMEPERIKAFIHKRFDEPIARHIWAQLEEHRSLDLYSSPYYLNLLLDQIDRAADDIRIPDNRAGLFSGMVRERLRRECQKGNARFEDIALLGKRDRTVLLSGRPRATWLPDDTPFFPALAALAFHIQDASGSHERWGSLRRHKACRAIESALNRELPADTYLQAGYDLGLFEDDAAQADEIRFIHQQMQEYFAAWVLAEHLEPDKLAVAWKSSDLAASSTQALLAQGGDDDLPELAGTGWEESALMAASLCEEPDAFIRALIPANLALAGRCAAQAGLSLSEHLRSELQTALIARTQDPKADLRARIAAGRALGELGDPRLQAPSGRRGVRVLLPAFGPIAGGEYTIGGDPEGYADEQPAQTVPLADFELAVHAVTNAEFACFVQAGGYREDACWTGRGLQWRDGEVGQEATQQRIREGRQVILNALGREASAEAIRDHYNCSLANAKWWQERLSVSDADFETWLAQAFPPPEGPFTQPLYWRSLTWGNAAQPVVGVCWYEAQAYCRWLNRALDSERYRLPSEAEWEAAGRGRGAWRRYAWPGDFDPLKVNTAETRLGVTAPVGVCPEGATPDTGLLDLCGNCWEWTATPWSEGDAWNPALGSSDGAPEARRVVRGGSWRSAQGDARLGSRGSSAPDVRYYDLGFRLCRASPI